LVSHRAQSTTKAVAPSRPKSGQYHERLQSSSRPCCVRAKVVCKLSPYCPRTRTRYFPAASHDIAAFHRSACGTIELPVDGRPAVTIDLPSEKVVRSEIVWEQAPLPHGFHAVVLIVKSGEVPLDCPEIGVQPTEASPGGPRAAGLLACSMTQLDPIIALVGTRRRNRPLHCCVCGRHGRHPLEPG
jgi:hypothetical protein